MDREKIHQERNRERENTSVRSHNFHSIHKLRVRTFHIALNGTRFKRQMKKKASTLIVDCQKSQKHARKRNVTVGYGLFVAAIQPNIQSLNEGKKAHTYCSSTSN